MSGVCRLGCSGKCNFVPFLKEAVKEGVKVFTKKPLIPEPLKEAFWVNKDVVIKDEDVVGGYHGTCFKLIEEQLAKGKLEQRGDFYFGSIDTAAHFALGADNPVVLQISSPDAPITAVQINQLGRIFVPNHPGFKYPVVPISAFKLNPDYIDYRLNPSRRKGEPLKNRCVAGAEPLKPLLGCPKVKQVGFVALAAAGAGVALYAAS